MLTNKNMLMVNDKIKYHTIKDICNQCFGQQYKGYQKGSYKINDYYMAWFPKIAYTEDGVIKPGSETKGWINEVKDDGLCIVESNINEKRDVDSSKFQILRLVFSKYKDEDYKFMGVYKTVSYYDENVDYAKRIHRRIATEVNLGALGKESCIAHEQTFLEDISKIKDITDTEKIALVKCRIGQSDFRDKLFKKYDRQCAICGLKYKELLVASHIKAWSDSEGNERLDVDNGLLLCSLHDALFDKHMISFDESGDLLISPKIDAEDLSLLNISNINKLEMSDAMKKYMSSHRMKFEELKS